MRQVMAQVYVECNSTNTRQGTQECKPQVTCNLHVAALPRRTAFLLFKPSRAYSLMMHNTRAALWQCHADVQQQAHFAQVARLWSSSRHAKRVERFVNIQQQDTEGAHVTLTSAAWHNHVRRTSSGVFQHQESHTQLHALHA